METQENKSEHRVNDAKLEQEFWKTLEILVSPEWKRTEKDVMDDVQDWVDKVVARRDTKEDDDEDYLGTSKSKKSGKSSSGYGTGNESELEGFLHKINLSKLDCKFSHPYVRSRLEILMGSNLVSLTDRGYMQKLQHRILEDYENTMNKRIAGREFQETERVKNLVLTGRIPLDQAPPEMANHPVRLIELYCQKLIAERRAKIKVLHVNIPTHLYWDDTPDPPSGLSIEKGHVFRPLGGTLCHPSDCFTKTSNEETIEKGYMLEPDESDALKYVDPLMEQLRECMGVEEMFNLADEIIGNLKDMPEYDNVSVFSALN